MACKEIELGKVSWYYVNLPTRCKINTNDNGPASRIVDVLPFHLFMLSTSVNSSGFLLVFVYFVGKTFWILRWDIDDTRLNYLVFSLG